MRAAITHGLPITPLQGKALENTCYTVKGDKFDYSFYKLCWRQ